MCVCFECLCLYPCQQTGAREWVRILKGGLYTKADDRDVDVPAISAMLQRRIECKTRKDYGTADTIASQLQAMGICYLDRTLEWYTKAPEETSGGGEALGAKPKDSKPSAAHLASKKASGIKKKITKKKAPTRIKTPNKAEASLMKSIKKSSGKA
jgi:hypothetical protein